ncbi:hypothetical protein D915_006622 [Fasciola hepatica]|uniref:Uncharacterized protein n=1 Tax=Fasciola hepatica TaxID=6192 RepID=A0A4E0R4F7_FASHE|nr:hypothetical protein D915_006622 [Fasciola hepatica]
MTNESSRETEGDVEMMEESDADEDATGIPENTDEHVERTENDNEAGSRVTDLPAGMQEKFLHKFTVLH